MSSRSACTVWLRAVWVLLVVALAVTSGRVVADVDGELLVDEGARTWAADSQASTAEIHDGLDDAGCLESHAFAGDGLADAVGLGSGLPCSPDGPCAMWGWRADALALWRTAPRSRPLFSYVAGTDIGPTALDSNQLVSDPLAAPRVAIFRDNQCGQIVEASYLWAGNFYSERTLPFVQDGYATSPPGIFDNQWGPATDTALDAAQATLTANLQTAELNFRERFLHGMAQFIIGFRWLQWNESLRMQDSYSATSEFGPIFGTDLYGSECFNNLYGGQIGIDAILLRSASGFRIDGLVKAGAFYNDSLQRSTYAYADTSPFEFSTTNETQSPDGAAFVGEVGMTAVIPLHCNLDLRVGYFGLWIEGLAQPTNQLSTQTLTQVDPPSGTLDNSGSVVLQGLSLGLEGRW